MQFLLYIAHIKIQCFFSPSQEAYMLEDLYTDIYVFEWMSHYAKNVAFFSVFIPLALMLIYQHFYSYMRMELETERNIRMLLFFGRNAYSSLTCFVSKIKMFYSEIFFWGGMKFIIWLVGKILCVIGAKKYNAV